MTNEMKLLMAMCDALGFEVETTRDFKEASTSLTPIDSFAPQYYRFSTDNSGAYKKDKNDNYIISLNAPIVDYKLTKREG